MNNEQRAFLRNILIRSYDHNRRIHAVERAARGLVRLGGNERIIDLDGLKFDLVEDVLNVLGVPKNEDMRYRFRLRLFRAGTNEPDPAKIDVALLKIDEEIGRMFN